MVKEKTPRFYIPQPVRVTVLAASEACGLPPARIIEGAVAHLVNEHARTGQPFGPSFAAMVERAISKAAPRPAEVEVGGGAPGNRTTSVQEAAGG